MKIEKSNKLMALAAYVLQERGQMSNDVQTLISVGQVKTWLTNLEENVYVDGAVLSFEEACGLMMLFCLMLAEDLDDSPQVVFQVHSSHVYLIGEEELDGRTAQDFPGLTFRELDDDQEKKMLDENDMEKFSVEGFIEELVVACGGDPKKF